MSLFLDMNFAECSNTQVPTELGPSPSLNYPCVCCLERTGPFVNLRLCSHKEVLTNLSRDDWKVSNMVACLLCHRMLEKINLFRHQVQESLQCLTNQANILTTTRKINLLQHTQVKTSFYCDTESVEPSLHPDLNNKVQIIKQELLVMKSYVSDDEMNNDREFIKEEYNSDDNLSQLKDIIMKVKKKEKKVKNKKSKCNKNKNTLKDIVCNVQNSLSDNTKYRKKAPNIVSNRDGHQNTVKAETSEWEEKHYMAKLPKNTKGGIGDIYEDKIEVIRLTPEQVVEERAADMLKEEYADKPYKCNDCIKGFVVENELEAHNKKWHYTKDGCFQCELCKRTLKGCGTFYSHVNRHYHRYRCVICKQIFVTLNQATLHYNDAHGSAGHRIPTGHTCTECSLTFPSPKRYRYHFDKHHRTWQCDDCHRTVCSRSALIAHIRNVHNSASFECKECGKTFRTLAYLAAHSSVHRARKKKNPDETHYCVQCDKIFSTRSALGYHLKSSLKHVTDDDDNRFECKQCSSKFVDKKGLQQHIDLIHLNIRRHSCQDCDKAFKTNESLRRHRNDIHLKLPRKPKDKICHICGHGFDANRHLTIHMRRHTGERPLSCDMCNATFAHPAALYTHRKLRHKILPKKTLDGRVRTDCTVPHS